MVVKRPQSGVVICGISDPHFYALMKLLCLTGRQITEFTVHAVAGEVLSIETVEILILEDGKPKRDAENHVTTEDYAYVLVEAQAAKEAGLI